MFVTNSVSIDGRVRKEAATLAAAGREVTVIGLRDAGYGPREQLEGFQVLRVRWDTLHGRGAGTSKRGIVRAFGWIAIAFAMVDYYLRAFVAAVASRFDVYHAHDLVTLPLAWAASRVRDGRLIYDAHELFTEMGRLGALPRRVFGFVERLLIGRADRVITVNVSIASELAQRYGVPTPLVILNCPRTAGRRYRRDASPLRERVGLPPDTPLVLYQGLFMQHRGLENLVRAVPLFSRAHLVLMGWGPLRDELRELVDRQGLAGRVLFSEPVPMEDLLRYTAGADLGVIPYLNVGLNNYYTSPNKLFEYCAAGVPVAASRFPELVKVVEGLAIGRTFDPERPEDIAAVVNGILDDPAALQQVRENVARVAERFTWEAESGKLLEAYRALEAA